MFTASFCKDQQVIPTTELELSMSSGLNKISSEKQNTEVNIIPRLSEFSYLITSWRIATDSAAIASSTLEVGWYINKSELFISPQFFSLKIQYNIFLLLTKVLGSRYKIKSKLRVRELRSSPRLSILYQLHDLGKLITS